MKVKFSHHRLSDKNDLQNMGTRYSQLRFHKSHTDTHALQPIDNILGTLNDDIKPDKGHYPSLIYILFPLSFFLREKRFLFL